MSETGGLPTTRWYCALCSAELPSEGAEHRCPNVTFIPTRPDGSLVPVQWIVLPCPSCGGRGEYPVDMAPPNTKCNLCDGRGLVKRRYDQNELVELHDFSDRRPK